MAFVSPSPKQPSPITVGTSKNFIQVGGLAPSNSSGLFSSSFSPLSLSPTVWLRSDLGITQSGGTVSQWNDQSGNGYNVTQSSGSNKPTYTSSGGVGGQAYLSFNSAATQFLQNTSFTFPTTTPLDVFMIASPVTIPAGAYTYLLDLGENCNVTFIAGSASAFSLYNGSQINSSTSLSSGGNYVVESMNDGSGNGSIATNGGTPVTGAISGTAQLQTYLTVGAFGGSADGWLGNIYEVILFNYVLSTSQRTQILNYVSSRYGISV